MSSSNDVAEVPLGQYIFDRIKSLGIQHIFGCPGDFNLNLLDHMSTSGLKWIGTCNELNAAYAADGYSRIRGLPGVLVTTYGVGELSAINGVSGAYAEHVPMIHLVGMTSRMQHQAKMMIHHTLGQRWNSADHLAFMGMSIPVRTGAAFLNEDESFAEEVDRVLELCFHTRRPVYLFVPMDTPDILIDASRLKTPLNLEIQNAAREEDENQIVDDILKMLTAAKRPTILVDALVQRYGLIDQVRELVALSEFPVFTTPLSKSFIDETHSTFRGVYIGAMTGETAIKTELENSDAVLYLGPLPSDSATGGFSYSLKEEAKITMHSEFVSIGTQKFDGIHFVPVVKKLVAKLRSKPVNIKQDDSRPTTNGTSTESVPKTTITGPLQQHYFWRCFEPYFREGDCVIAEVGTAQFATLEIKLPTKAQYFTQIFYSCIGFTVGALLGALVARREMGFHTGRTILFVGDGSLQMTVQELGTIIRQGFTPTIILINNAGYTVERVIHGPTRDYNDISEGWDYQNMLKFFGAKDSKSYSAKTYEELHDVLDKPEFAEGKTIQLLEAFMDKYDAPWNMIKLVAHAHKMAGSSLAKWDKECGRRRVAKDTNLMDSEFVLKDSPSYRRAME